MCDFQFDMYLNDLLKVLKLRFVFKAEVIVLRRKQVSVTCFRFRAENDELLPANFLLSMKVNKTVNSI